MKRTQLFEELDFLLSHHLESSLFDFLEFDAFGDVLQPTSTVLNPVAPISKQQNGGATTPNSSEQKILSTNLDASLASLANNLDINYKNNNFQ